MCNHWDVPAFSSNANRWQLYRLLGDKMRLRLLALCAAEELSVGELSELLDQSQPNISRTLAPLRSAGLLETRRDGKRVLVRLSPRAGIDPVVVDALESGRRLCEVEGSLSRVSDIVLGRDKKSRDWFAREQHPKEPPRLAEELPGYAAALAMLLPHRRLAVDVGTGDGALLDLVAPLFEQVVAVDRSGSQLGRAEQRIRRRGYANVQLVEDAVDGEHVRQAVGSPGADLVVASRFLHHAPRPREAFAPLRDLARPGGSIVLLDYKRHEDEGLREQQADVWLGFEPSELVAWAEAAALAEISVSHLPAGFVRNSIDGHLPWLVLRARRPQGQAPTPSSQLTRKSSP